MEVVRLDPQSFLDRAGEFLLGREAQHNLMLGLAGRLTANSRVYGSEPYLAVVEDGTRVVAAALRTPPHGLVLSELDDDGAPGAIAADVREVFAQLPGVLGPVTGVRRFVEVWEMLTGASGRFGVSERIYRAGSVTPPTGVSGRARPYGPGDRELVMSWIAAFVEEALPQGSSEQAAEILDRRLDEDGGRVVLWEDGEPVSLAACGGLTPNGIRIGPVYTPPGSRGRGYAGALTADLTASLLAGGRRFCFLFTDLANPASNKVYQRIGYEPVTDVDQWLFASE